MNQEEWERHATDVALARYAVIAPLIRRQLNRDERRLELEKVVGAVHKFPDGDRKVSGRTVRRWCDWYRNGHLNEDVRERDSDPGIDGLKPARRADLGQTRALDPAIVEQAVRLRAEMPSRSTQTILDLLRDQALANNEPPPHVDASTLAYHLRARGATKRDFKEQTGRAYPRYEHPYRNSCWQGDWATGIRIPDPLRPEKTRLCHLHAFIDDHTRYVPHAEFYFRQNLPCLEDCFRKAVLKGGVPERTYWDNGAVYQARQIQLMAARLGTQVIFATPYAPEGKGKVERFLRTCKERFYPEAIRADIKTLEELNEFFWAWLDKAYHDREHGSLEGKTPRDRWETGASGARTPEPSSLVDLFLWEEVRKVDKAGCIKLSGNVYPVGEHLVGQPVNVRFDPFDLTQIRIYSGSGVFLETVKPQVLTMHTYRKALPRRTEKPAPLESSTVYRKQLSRSFRQEVDETVSQVRRDGRQTECLTGPEFCGAVEAALCGRELTAAERRLVLDFFRRNAPLQTEAVRRALVTAVDEKGCFLHIRFYLDAVREARLRRDHG
ncbi:MAG: DDE-type integrase/transposase/recombinase [Candidatus Eremiobacteraeota bacterium]|nr:DDE-type integrase/transposase/recombinase [Candidatus Eremiobacteraeota bacterium]